MMAAPVPPEGKEIRYQTSLSPASIAVGRYVNVPLVVAVIDVAVKPWSGAVVEYSTLRVPVQVPLTVKVKPPATSAPVRWIDFIGVEFERRVIGSELS